MGYICFKMGLKIFSIFKTLIFIHLYIYLLITHLIPKIIYGMRSNLDLVCDMKTYEFN